LDLYSNEYNKILTTYENKRVGLPLFSIVTELFSSEKYLTRYKKNPPKTWNELIETSEYIINEERIKNNNILIGYNGLFPDNENTLCSIYQLLYSYRDKKDSPIPEFSNKVSIDAFNKIYEVMKRISSNEIFKSNELYLIDLMQKEKIIFSNFYSTLSTSIMPNYKVSILPGKNEGVNGSILGGFNIGINKNISKEKLNATLEVIKYFSSEDFQKKIIIKQLKLFSGLEKLYDDDEVCKNVNCSIIKDSQFYIRPSSTLKDYQTFSDRVKKYFYKFLDGELKAVNLESNYMIK